MPTPGQAIVAAVIVVAVFMAAGFLVPFNALMVGLLVAFGALGCKFVP